MSLFLKSLSASPLKDATPIALVKRADDSPSGILLLDTEANIGQELIELAPESGETFQLLPEKKKTDSEKNVDKFQKMFGNLSKSCTKVLENIK